MSDLSTMTRDELEREREMARIALLRGRPESLRWFADVVSEPARRSFLPSSEWATQLARPKLEARSSHHGTSACNHARTQ